MAGGYGGGAWYLEESEIEPPTIYDNVPVCGSTNVTDPLTVITLKLQDLPYPTGGSGIDDTKTTIFLSVASQAGGSFRKVFDGGTQPWSPTVTVTSVPGVDPNLDRTVTITVAAGYIDPGDVVVVRTFAQDLDGNAASQDCTFEMEAKDTDPPEIINESPECGLGTTATDTRRAAQDSTFSFKATDADSGIDVTTLQVYTGPSSTGPWTQVLQNGATFLGGFTGSVVSDGSGGYDVVIRRPVADPLWTADSTVCFRTLVDDNEGNGVEEVCCFKVAPCVSVTGVRPIAENILLVEFSGPVKNNEALRSTVSYVITPVDPDETAPVLVKRTLPQRFAAAADPLQPDTRLGVDDPNVVFLDTSIMTPWGLYTLQTVGLVDKFGNEFCPGADPIKFRARRTKVDEGRDSQLDNPLLQQDSLMRRVVIALQHENEVVGGVYVPDNWEDL